MIKPMNTGEPFGNLLHVNLSSGRCELAPFPETALEYLGGRGFNIWHLYHHLPAETHPLEPENILLLSCGLLTGSSAPSGARLHLNALSPLTGILGSSNIGGYAGAWLRSCGFASVIITGKAPSPVCLSIETSRALITDAKHLWGCDVFETQDRIQRSHCHQKISILTIGPGGENRVRFAAILSGRDHAAGRTGLGAVMGSKNLKAIVFHKGSYKHLAASTPIQKEAVQRYTSLIKNSSEFNFFSKFGGAGYVKWVNDFGIMGSRNYSAIGVNHIEKIDGRQLAPKVRRSSGCFRCPVQCKAHLKLNQSGASHTRPEFEPIINLGPKCGLNDLDQIIRLDNLCNRLGVDSLSAAAVIAFAMTLYEKKMLPEDLAGDLDLSWGNAATMETLLHQMVANRGLGKILRLGVKKAAELIGNESSRHAAHVKGLELTAYHPSAIMGTALGYAVSSRGGDYNNVYASLEYSWSETEAQKEFGTKEAVNIKSIEAKGRLIKKAVVTNAIIDSLGLCKVPALSLLKSFNLVDEANLINGLTGLNLTPHDLVRTGEKIAALERLFNIRHSKGAIKDQLPEMVFKSNGSGLTRQNFETMLQGYYTAMGWDRQGVPMHDPKKE